MEAGNGSVTAASLTKVMVFCDGTWCGQLTGTDTNVKLLADTVAGKPVKSGQRFERTGNVGESRIVGVYYDGEGVQGDFSDYLLDGALGGRMRQDCLEPYKFLMQEFEDTNGECEAWLIGLSRGSYTVRCVAGMINNCGLISKKVIAERLGHPPTDLVMEDIIQRGYGFYRDRTTAYVPSSEYMKEWKRCHSRVTTRPPVKFMGLFETVGALGIPNLNPGMGVDYLGSLNFFGKADEGASAISGEVERVYQSLAVHDRLTVFTPCQVKRDKFPKDYSYNAGCEESHLNFQYITEERWFPGAHYDLGRQKFMFYKSPTVVPENLKTAFKQFKFQTGTDMLTKLVGLKTALKQLKIQTCTDITKRVGQNIFTFLLTVIFRIPEIHPNCDYSDAVLFWMAENMQETDLQAFGTLHAAVKKTADAARVVGQTPWPARLFDRFKPKPLINDAYDHLTENKYLTLVTLPFAHRFLMGLMDRYLLMDRIIVDPTPSDPLAPPAPPAPPVKFHRASPRVVSGADRDALLKTSVNYRSRSYDSYKLNKDIMNRPTG